jgi:hypothetical protein
MHSLIASYILGWFAPKRFSSHLCHAKVQDQSLICRRFGLMGNTMIRHALSLSLLFFCAAARGVQAADPPPIRMKETVTINKVGDGQFTRDIKMPIADYTQQKVRYPNTAVLLRHLGIVSGTKSEVEQIKGSFEDSDSTVRLQWVTRGLARCGPNGLWEVPLHNGDMWDILSLRDQVAILSTAMETYLGLATYTVHVNVPPGSSELQVLKNPWRLGFRMPKTEQPANGKVAVDLSFQVKPQLMSCLAKAYSSSKFPTMWVARTVFKNTGEQTVKDYRIRFRIPDYTPAWGPWLKSSEVVPGQTVVDAYFPVFDLEKMGRMNTKQPAAVEMEYQYERLDGKIVRDSDSRTLEILSRNEVVYSTMPPREALVWQDYFNYSPAILASFVSHNDPIMQQVAGWVSGQDRMLGASYTDEDAIQFLRNLHAFVAANRITYQSPVGGIFNGDFGQHVKWGRDVLRNRAGTCIDLAVLYGSVCEAVGMRPVLFMVPGHCFPAVVLPQSGKLFAVESTMITSTFEQAAERGKKDIEDAFKDKRYWKVDIKELQAGGISSLELPALPPTALADWGIRRLERTTTIKQRNNSPPQWIVGSWSYKGRAGDIYATLNSNGTYSTKRRSGNNGAWIQEQGTFSVGKAQLTFTPEGKSSFTRDYEMSKGILWVTFREIELILPFQRAKE